MINKNDTTMIYKVLRFNCAILLTIVFCLFVDYSYVILFELVTGEILPRIPFTGIVAYIIAHILIIFIPICGFKLLTILFTDILAYMAKTLRMCVNGNIAISIIPVIIFILNLIDDFNALFFIIKNGFNNAMDNGQLYYVGATITFAGILLAYVSCIMFMFTDNNKLYNLNMKF